MSISEQPSKTPILDLTVPLPEPPPDGNTLRKALPILAVVLAALALKAYAWVAAIVGYFTVRFVATAVHEFGHCLAGWGVGMRLECVAVGPLLIKRDAIGWALQRRRHLLAGFIQMSITNMRRVRRRLLVYYAGGLTASLVTGTVALALCRVEEIGGNPALGLPMAGFAILSLLSGIQSLRPIRIGSYSGDGLLLRTLLQSYEGARQQIAAHALQMLKVRGLDRSQWNRRWVRVASNITDVQRQTYYSDWLAYELAADSDTAAECLERCLAGSAHLGREEREENIDDLFLEAAIVMAWHRNDAAKANVWLKRAVHPERAWTLTRIKAGAALCCASGSFTAALAEWEKGLEFIHQLPSGKRTDQTESRWLEWKAQLQARRTGELATKHQSAAAFPI